MQLHNCNWCGEDFRPDSRPTEDGFCSDACRGQAEQEAYDATNDDPDEWFWERETFQ